jgi:hypothetical protein
MPPKFCAEHGIDAEDSELIVWLVRRHLLMSSVAQKQDIADPDVVGAFAATVKDERQLVALYLFTVADIRGTSPKVWNTWKGQLLEQLFRSTCRTLLAGGQVPVRQGLIEERQQEALRLLRYFALPDAVHQRLWRQLDTVYFLRHSAEEIAWHTRALHYRTRVEEPVVKARVNPQGEGLEVMIYTRDQRDLFARLVGFFSRAGYTIVDAKIHTTRHGYALDSFMLLDLSDRGSDRAMITYIEHELSARLSRLSPPEAPGSGRISRQVRHFPVQPLVTIEPDEKGLALCPLGQRSRSPRPAVHGRHDFGCTQCQSAHSQDFDARRTGRRHLSAQRRRPRRQRQPHQAGNRVAGATQTLSMFAHRRYPGLGCPSENPRGRHQGETMAGQTTVQSVGFFYTRISHPLPAIRKSRLMQ